MSLRDYTGHKPNCSNFKQQLDGSYVKIAGSLCTCGLDKTLAEYDARERAIDDLLTECERLVNLVPERCDTLDDLLRKLEEGR